MKYILLNALTHKDFEIATHEEFKEAVEEMGCKLIKSNDIKGYTKWYICAPTKAALEQLVDTVDLDGTMVVATEVHEQIIIEE